MRASRLVTAALALACVGEGDVRRAAQMADDTGAAAAEPSTDVVQVTLREWMVELSMDSVPAGAVSFQIGNRGDFAHTFEMQGGGDVWKVENITSGQDATLRIELEPGIYDVLCPLEDAAGSHESRGMRAQLVVTPSRD